MSAPEEATRPQRLTIEERHALTADWKVGDYLRALGFTGRDQDLNIRNALWELWEHCAESNTLPVEPVLRYHYVPTIPKMPKWP